MSHAAISFFYWIIHPATIPIMPVKTSFPLSYTSYYVEKRKTKRVFLK